MMMIHKLIYIVNLPKYWQTFTILRLFYAQLKK